jgi:hypothetical protein
MFSLWKNPVQKCTRSFPRCNVNRGKVTSFGLAACSAVYYHAGSSLQLYSWVFRKPIVYLTFTILIPVAGCGEHLIKTTFAKECGEALRLAASASFAISHAFKEKFIGKVS